jgi:hypothetical protein
MGVCLWTTSGAPRVPGYGSRHPAGHRRQQAERLVPACPQLVDCGLEFAFMFLGDLQLRLPPDTPTPNRTLKSAVMVTRSNCHETQDVAMAAVALAIVLCWMPAPRYSSAAAAYRVDRIQRDDRR